jgi:hypothetical protein
MFGDQKTVEKRYPCTFLPRSWVLSWGRLQELGSHKGLTGDGYFGGQPYSAQWFKRLAFGFLMKVRQSKATHSLH